MPVARGVQGCGVRAASARSAGGRRVGPYAKLRPRASGCCGRCARLGEAEVLEGGWDLVGEAAAVALAEPVPAADGVVCRPGPRFDGALLGGLVLIGVAE